MLHVVSDARGRWRVLEEGSREPLSEHTTATDAEIAAQRHARARGAEAVLLHDRYGRTHPVGREFEPLTPARG